MLGVLWILSINLFRYRKSGSCHKMKNLWGWKNDYWNSKPFYDSWRPCSSNWKYPSSNSQCKSCPVFLKELHSCNLHILNHCSTHRRSCKCTGVRMWQSETFKREFFRTETHFTPEKIQDVSHISTFTKPSDAWNEHWFLPKCANLLPSSALMHSKNIPKGNVFAWPIESQSSLSPI